MCNAMNALHRVDAQDFQTSGSIDPTLPASSQISAILTLLEQLSHLTARQGLLKPKQLGAMQGTLSKDGLAAVLPSKYAGGVVRLADLKEGKNAEVALVCRPLLAVDAPAGIAAM